MPRQPAPSKALRGPWRDDNRPAGSPDWLAELRAWLALVARKD